MRQIEKRASEPPGVPALTEILQADLARAGLRVESPALKRLAQFVSILLRASDDLSLSTIRDPEEAVQRQVVEPLAGWQAIQAGIPPGPLVEVGTGGGAPGLPIAIAVTDRAVTLVEARERRSGYLRDLVTELGLSNVTVVEKRGELFGAAGEAGRERFACAMGRALAKLPVALELLLPLVRVDGVAAVYAGPSAEAALDEAGWVASALGAEPPRLQAVSWPGAPLRLSMLTCRKSAPTAERFPRSLRRMRKGPPT